MPKVAKPPAPKTKRRVSKADSTYYGVHIQDMSAGSQFTSKEIRKAVDAAIAKNPDAFTTRKP